VTCPRKYCLIDTCTNDLDSYHPDALPNPDADPEQYQTYQPHEPPTVASQVECIAGNTFMYLAVFTVISLALQLTPISDSIVEIIMIILGVATGISLVIAAVAEQFVDRHKATDTEPPPW
jgi:hypothetical protein